MNRNALNLADTRRTLATIDNDYTSIGCIGRGGFGDVFLAQRKSGRRVALKVMPMDTSDDAEYKTFTREIESVVELNSCNGDDGNRDLNIIYFEDWFVSRNFVCIVMQYADGGTLAQEIERKGKCCPVEPYAERRIAWYTLQVSKVLFCTVSFRLHKWSQFIMCCVSCESRGFLYYFNSEICYKMNFKLM